MQEHTRDPKEDISYIRSILEKTTAGMKTVAPWFIRFGVLWLVYGLLCAVLRLSQGLVSPAAQIRMANAGAILSWVFYIALAVGFFAARRRLAARGLDTLALKLLDMWGVCILLFLVLCVGLSVIPTLSVRLLGLGIEQTGAMNVAGAMVRSHLFFLLPIAPLLMTALFLENRRMLFMGAALAVLGALFCGCNMLLMYAGGVAVSRGWVLGSTLAACLLDIVPGVMLLLFGRQLKRM